METNNLTYNLTIAAKEDIELTLDYISQNLNNKKAANDMLDKIFEAINQICRFPYAQTTCADYLIFNDNFRRIFIDNYVLIYEIKQEQKSINILRFLYAKMNINDQNINN